MENPNFDIPGSIYIEKTTKTGVRGRLAPDRIPLGGAIIRARTVSTQTVDNSHSPMQPSEASDQSEAPGTARVLGAMCQCTQLFSSLSPHVCMGGRSSHKLIILTSLFNYVC